MAILALPLAAIIAGCGKIGDTPVEAAAPASDYISPEFTAVSPDGSVVYATCATAQKIAAARLDGQSAPRFWPVATAKTASPVPANPTGIAVAPDGGVWITCGIQGGELQHYSKDGRLLGAVSVGHSPCSPVVSADGRTVYALGRFNARIMEIDAATMAVKRGWSALREPFAAALGGGGRLLFVANMLPYCAATDDVVAAAVTIVDLASGEVRNILLPNGSTGVRGLCASADGRYVYVTHTMGRYQLPTTQLERGWMNTAALSVFDGGNGGYVNTVLLDDIDRGAANPWGVAASADGRFLYVAHAGTCELSVIDRLALHDRLEKAKRGESASGIVKEASDVPNDLAFLVSIRKRIHLGGNGPRGVAAAGGKAVAALYFADALVVVDAAADDAAPPLSTVRLGPEKDLAKDRVRRGEMLYNDGSMCFQQWQSCASCHPDGRVDGLNWDLLNDGVGNPKQTKSELYSQWTPPTMATGIRKDMHTCNMAGLVHIQFVTRPEEDVFCLDAYVTSMKPVPSPCLANGALSARAKRGKAVFAKAKCDKCHGDGVKGPDGEIFWTDLARYDVGTGTATEKGKMFDTPALAECWRTAPYLYDGRALTMKEVITAHNRDDAHGETENLTEEEIGDLAEYVLSL